jgi:magnesium-transporting ATPase (P-type)
MKICEAKLWGEIKIGDLIFLKEKERAPCDMIIIDC